MSEDLIYRWMAIAVADYSDCVELSIEDVKKVTDEVVKGLKQLPSAQLEIIRCRDCLWYKNADECFFSTAWTPEDGFCHWAERRTDEVNY